MRESFIYGLNPVAEALRAGRQMGAIYVLPGRHKGSDEIRALASKRGITVKEMPPAFFEGRFPKGHQGVAAEVKEKGYTPFDELMAVPAQKNEPAFFLVLDEIEDPRNLGAIIRSADAAGVHGVVVQAHRAAGLGPAASKSSAGAVEYVPVSSVPNIKNAIRAMKEEGILIVGAEGGAGASPYDIDLSVPLALVVGSEGSGLRRTVKENCDILAGLPMRGKVNSLNASVAAGALLYEILRQRMSKK